MWSKRVSAGLIVAAIGVVSVATLAAATESFDDGMYTLVLPGAGTFEFEIDLVDPVGEETVIVVSTPPGYAVDDDDPDKAAWKNAAALEVEVKSGKVEGDYDWAGGDATLVLPGGGSIMVTEPNAEGNFDVTTSGDWWAFGSGSDWFVADDEDIALANLFFKVEANENGIEIKATDGPDDGFLNDLDDDEDEEEDEEVENLELEEEDEGEEDGENNGRGPGKPDSDS